MKWAVLFFLLTGARSSAEHYLTVAEARKLCFPGADRFSERRMTLSDVQVKAIENRSGVKVRKREITFQIANRGETPIGLFIADQVYGKHELIDYAVALTMSGEVLQVEVLEYRERYGSDIRSPKWRAQFAGKNAGSPLKLNEDIYNISGATISCRHVSDGIRRLLATYDLVGRTLFDGGELPHAR